MREQSGAGSEPDWHSAALQSYFRDAASAAWYSGFL